MIKRKIFTRKLNNMKISSEKKKIDCITATVNFFITNH